MKQTLSTTISSKLLETLKSLTSKKGFNSLYQISEYLKEEKKDIIFFDYVRIISYTEDVRVYKKFSELLIPDFGEEMISLQDDILTFLPIV